VLNALIYITEGHQAELNRKLEDQAKTESEIEDLMLEKERFALERAKKALTYSVCKGQSSERLLTPNRPISIECVAR
jgi:hypothetical protein